MSLPVRSGEDPAPDVLASASEHEPRLEPSTRRRLRVGSGIIIVLIAAVAGGREVQERRVAAGEARRLAAPPKLSAYGPVGFGLESSPPPYLSAVLNMEFGLRNECQEDVTVTHASAGAFVLSGPRPAPGAVVTCPGHAPGPPMQRRHSCGNLASASRMHWPGPLQVTVTSSRDSQTITLAQPPYSQEHAAAICGWLRNGQPDGRTAVPPG